MESVEIKSQNVSKRKPSYLILLTFLAVLIVMMSASFWISYQTMRAEAYARFQGIKNVSAEKIAKTVRGVEMNAQNIFDDVEHHLDTPDHVIAALERKANLNLDVRGYFAAFELNYFPEKGAWFEPYIYQPDVTGFEYRQVGSARHNYTKSPWYIRAKSTRQSFWSEPYYYYDGTSMSGHYSTFIKPIFDANGDLVCVCGADIKFEWLATELEWVDKSSKENDVLNKYHLFRDFDFYSVILNNDGTCIAHPEDLSLTITDKEIIDNLVQKRSGIVDMDVNGEACTVYYGPIEYVDWSLAVIVPKQDFWQPMVPVGGVLLLIAVMGMALVWFVYRKVIPEKQ